MNRSKRKKRETNRKKKETEGAAAAQACSALRASPAEPAYPPTRARGPRSRPSNALPPTRAQSTDEPDLPVRCHAPHAAASGQADKRAPSVSRPATASSSSPRFLPTRSGADHGADAGPGSRTSHDPIPPCAAPTLPHASRRMRRTHHLRLITVHHWSPWSSAIKANAREP